LAVSKLVAQKFDIGKFDFRKLIGLEVRKQYQLSSQTGLQL